MQSYIHDLDLDLEAHSKAGLRLQEFQANLTPTRPS